MKNLNLAALFALVTTLTFCQNGSRIGSQAPDMSFDRLVNASLPGALRDYKGKVVILDYWATWCAPCVASFPKLEKLQEKHKANLQILAITGESESRIEKFLAKRPTSLAIVVDAKGTLRNQFPHRSIPHTVIIDKSGIVRAITTSSEVTPEIVEKVISGEPVSLPEKIDAMDFDPSIPLSGSSNFLCQLTITPYQEGLPAFSNSRGGSPFADRRIVATNVALQTLFEIAFQFPSGIRTAIESSDKEKLKWSKETAYCFDLIVPEDMGEHRFKIMQQQLGNFFPFAASVEQREIPVNLLKVVSMKTLKEAEAAGNREPEASFGGGGLSMKSGTFDIVANFLENMLNIVVVDETGIVGKYDLEIPWYHENPKQIYQELKNIGLELVDGRRTMPVLVIRDQP